MYDTLVAGGPVMVPIGLLSVGAVAVFLERSWSLRAGAVSPPGVVREVLGLVADDKLDEAVQRCRSSDTAISRVLQAGISSTDSAREAIKVRMEEVGRREAAELERWVPVMGTIASVAPLLGLLGTVLGMILTFQAIQNEGGLADVGALAGGISQALVTTFAGLTVGIPAVMANRWLLARVDQRVLELEEASLALLERLTATDA